MFRSLLILMAASLLAGCGGNLQTLIEDVARPDNPEYKSSRRLPPLEVPPDLTSESIRQTLVVPSSGEVTLSDLEENRVLGGVQAAAVLPEQDDIRVERNGDKRWLVINARPEQVWPKMREFWLENGFLIKVENPGIGIMETDWAENRADIPKGMIESVLSKISDSLYSAATRDKFRARLERGADPDSTELYISHRGAREIRTEVSETVVPDDTYRWEPRAADPELEAEMLSRMMIYFGVDREVAGQRIAGSRQRAARAHLTKDDTGDAVLALREDFSRAWRRTGLALDRVGFTVEDRDRSRGLYFVRYVDPASEGIEEGGVLSTLAFWKDDPEPAEREFLISLVGGETSTQIVVLNTEGQRASGATPGRILGLLHEQLR
ncbi:MAG: outer membrane protein assembly factor BamC [Pseudomonadota bacterium]